MKKFNVVILLVAMVFAACTSTPKSYVIEGVVPGASYNNQMVYLCDINHVNRIDSALVVDGKFTFTGLVDTAVIRSLLLLNQLYVDFIFENGKIYVDMADPNSAKGTPMNDELSKFYSEWDVFEETVRTKLTEIQQNGDIGDEVRQKQIDEFTEQYVLPKGEQLGAKYFNANNNNAVGALVLRHLSVQLQLAPDQFDAFYMQAGDVVRNFSDLKKISERNAKIMQTAEGMSFTDFTIENGNMDGSSVSLSDYVGKGKYVLADFWASWCGPCIVEIPVLVEVYNKYRGEKFEILGIAVWDKREDTQKSIESHNTTWPQILDTGEIATNLYGINMIPHIILFGPDGTIVARGLRGNRLKAKVAEIMQ